MSTVLVDTCVWYTIFDARERPGERDAVFALADQIQTMTAVVPWPIAYETLCTRFVKNRLALEGFERLLKSPRVTILDDAPYRQAALEHSLNSSLRAGRPLSLTDCLLRVVIDDPDIRIRYLATYNVGDFHDVCSQRRVQVLPQ